MVRLFLGAVPVLLVLTAVGGAAVWLHHRRRLRYETVLLRKDPRILSEQGRLPRMSAELLYEYQRLLTGDRRFLESLETELAALLSDELMFWTAGTRERFENLHTAIGRRIEEHRRFEI